MFIEAEDEDAAVAEYIRTLDVGEGEGYKFFKVERLCDCDSSLKEGETMCEVCKEKVESGFVGGL